MSKKRKQYSKQFGSVDLKVLFGAAGFSFYTSHFHLLQLGVVNHFFGFFNIVNLSFTKNVSHNVLSDGFSTFFILFRNANTVVNAETRVFPAHEFLDNLDIDFSLLFQEFEHFCSKKWLVPHFEKMLYDNALLTVSYLEAFQVTGNPRFKKIVEEILHYVTREMTSPDALFYSATDADSITPEG
ncbi:hypothetical protein KJ966_06060 [bacterium]|nr:hypothetical protein [bacterium]